MQPILRTLLAVLLAAGGCRGEPADDKLKPPASPAEAFTRLREAAGKGDLRRVFLLMDQGSRWSVMSIHRDQSQSCSLVRTHYPEQRRARELSRCSAAADSPDAEAFFARRAMGLPALDALGKLGPLQGQQAAGQRKVLARSGDQQVLLCQEDGGAWAYCGLQEALEKLKLKAARDLLTIRDNLEATGR